MHFFLLLFRFIEIRNGQSLEKCENVIQNEGVLDICGMSHKLLNR